MGAKCLSGWISRRIMLLCETEARPDKPSVVVVEEEGGQRLETRRN